MGNALTAVVRYRLTTPFFVNLSPVFVVKIIHIIGAEAGRAFTEVSSPALCSGLPGSGEENKAKNHHYCGGRS